MKRSVSLLTTIGALALAACETTPNIAQSAGQALTGHTWQLLEINHGNGNAINLSPQQQARHSLVFNGNGKLSLMLDCNRGNADWSASEPTKVSGVLTIGQIASTRALCPPPSYGEEMAADLPSARSFRLHLDGRSLTIITGHAVYTFVASDGAGADDAASYSFDATRRGDETAKTHGPERSVVPDAIVVRG